MKIAVKNAAKSAAKLAHHGEGDTMSDEREMSFAGSPTNVHDLERVLSIISGGIFALKGLGRDSAGGVFGMLAGAALLHRGITGHCYGYGAMGVSTADGVGARATGARWARGEARSMSNVVDEASDESFPASDAPSWTPVTSVGRRN